jgi:hypothetical protein
LDSTLYSRELPYAVAIGAVAVLVLLLLRRQPNQRSLAFYIVGAVVAYFGAPLLEAGFSLLERAIATGGFGFDFDYGDLWRTLIVGAVAFTLGVLAMIRGWRDSPAR